MGLFCGHGLKRAQAPPDRPARVEVPVTSLPHLPHLRILILEDDETDYARLVEALQVAGLAATTTHASDVTRFLVALDEPYDLIIADYSVPPFNADEAIGIVRGRGIDTPIIVVTSSVDDEAAVRCIQAGASDYLLKDRLARLGSAVERALVEHGLRQDNVVMEARLSYVLNYDEVTGLLKRALLDDRLERMLPILGPGDRLAVHFLDIDAFKDVNDTRGQEAGDDILRQVARRLETAVDIGDSVARLSGGKFAVLQGKVAAVGDIAIMADRLIRSFDAPFEVGGQQLFITASSGVAVFPEDGLDVMALFSAADMAMYEAKQAGRNRFQFSRPEFGEVARDRVNLTSDLRRALDENTLTVAFQPIISARDGMVVAVEALARLATPTRGAVGPAEFIPIAESAGLIHELGHQVHSISFMWLRQWIDAGHDIALNLNVSPHVFRHPGFEDQLGESARKYGVDPAHVTVEITESAIMEAAGDALALIHRLRAKGYGVAVDDFGTRFSMLASLRLPLTSLKIDKTFIDDLESDERSRLIAKVTTDLGHGLGLIVVAEGVETAAQRDILLELGVDEFQGYLYARPMPGEAIRDFIAANKRKTGVG
ncbi:MAG: GGDEF domain-containing response regulator [Dehalococcoidia bacterium]|nr:MAG: GGDEF domain-containing response regulator [Dehalococcoidia bacterium]